MNGEQSDKLGNLIHSLGFTPELGPPTLLEFLALLGIVACLIYAGYLVKNIWARQNELVPIPVALIMALVMFVVYFVMVTMLYNRTGDNQRTNILMWSVFALVAPAAYYGRIIVESFATRVIDQVSPFSLRIEEPSEFAEARKLALRRDIDGAVKRYRAYLENTDAALFEAARLLKAEDRFAEAASLFLEISERFYGKKVVWAEATYQLAKLKEANLHQAREAMALLEGILDRTPDSRFGQLAETELTRMRSVYSLEKDAPVGYAEPIGSEDPFFVEDEDTDTNAKKPRQRQHDGNGQRRDDIHEDLPIPAADPFYAATARRAAEEAQETQDDAQDSHEHEAASGAPHSDRDASGE